MHSTKYVIGLWLLRCSSKNTWNMLCSRTRGIFTHLPTEKFVELSSFIFKSFESKQKGQGGAEPCTNPSTDPPGQLEPAVFWPSEASSHLQLEKHYFHALNILDGLQPASAIVHLGKGASFGGHVFNNTKQTSVLDEFIKLDFLCLVFHSATFQEVQHLSIDIIDFSIFLLRRCIDL